MQRAGQMRDRAAFFRRQIVADGYGNERGAFPAEPFLSCWADMLERLGGERLEAGAIHAPRMATMRVRSAPETRAITEADMARVRGSDWNIRSIVAVGRNGEMLEFLLETEVAQ